MKAIITIILTMLIGAIALSENYNYDENKAESVEVGLRLDNCITCNLVCEQVALNESQKVTRLYRRLHTRVYKALYFHTKYSKIKLA